MNNNDDSVPRWAATAGQSSLAQRITARLLCLPQRRRTDGTSSPMGHDSDVPWPVRQRVLREYHAVNLIRARHASEQLVRAGFNTGAVPFGYRPQRVRVAPSGRRPRWRTQLVIEPVEAAAVKMIFMWRGVEQLSSAEIRRRLTEARYPAPLDTETGQQGVWTRAAVRAILRNPKYTGYQVWGRRHHGRRAPRAQWVWSGAWVHPPLITVAEFAAANRRCWLAATPPTDDDGPARGVATRRATAAGPRRVTPRDRAASDKAPTKGRLR